MIQFILINNSDIGTNTGFQVVDTDIFWERRKADGTIEGQCHILKMPAAPLKPQEFPAETRSKLEAVLKCIYAYFKESSSEGMAWKYFDSHFLPQNDSAAQYWIEKKFQVPLSFIFSGTAIVNSAAILSNKRTREKVPFLKAVSTASVKTSKYPRLAPFVYVHSGLPVFPNNYSSKREYSTTPGDLLLDRDFDSMTNKALIELIQTINTTYNTTVSVYGKKQILVDKIKREIARLRSLADILPPRGTAGSGGGIISSGSSSSSCSSSSSSSDDIPRGTAGTGSSSSSSSGSSSSTVVL